MYFLIDTRHKEVIAFKKLGEACRAGCQLLDTSISNSGDPVRTFNNIEQDRAAVLNLTDAFEAIADSDDEAAQELARNFQLATDRFYSNELR